MTILLSVLIGLWLLLFVPLALAPLIETKPGDQERAAGTAWHPARPEAVPLARRAEDRQHAAVHLTERELHSAA